MNNSGECKFGLALSERVDEMAAALAEVDKKASLSEKILERLEVTNSKLGETIEKFSDVMQQFEITMVNMQNKIDTTAEATKEVKEKVNAIEKKIEAVDEKSKIDWAQAVKDALTSKLVWLIGGGIAVVLALEIFASQNPDGVASFFNLLGK